MKFIDLTGKRFGKLLVLEKDSNRKEKGTYWKCKCDCGNIISTRKDTLTRKQNPKTSCGCDLQKKNSIAHLKDETGKRYGKLVVLNRVKNREGSKAARWHCKCDCGKECDVDGFQLRNGSVQSCGCQKFESHNMIDETGNRYGKLIVLYRSDRTDGSHVFWHCKCDCGNECDINGSYLRAGISSNCGCERSVGELRISKLLKENNIRFKREYTFPDLIGTGGGKLRFDFGILDNDDNLVYLIEYDGIQHFQSNCFGANDKLFNIYQEHDRLKNEYCKIHHIKLIRIPYTRLSEITIHDLMEE